MVSISSRTQGIITTLLLFLHIVEPNPCGIDLAKSNNTSLHTNVLPFFFHFETIIMRRKKEFTIVGRATTAVPAFKDIVRKLETQVELKGQSPSTFHNYLNRIAFVVAYFDRLPEDIDEDDINTYLVTLDRDPKSQSCSNFKPWFMDCLIIFT